MFFKLLADKTDQINGVICKAENERSYFLQASQMAEANNEEWRRDKEEVSRLRYFIERDQAEMQQLQRKYDDLLENQT